MKTFILTLLFFSGLAVAQLEAQTCCTPCPPECCITACSKDNSANAKVCNPANVAACTPAQQSACKAKAPSPVNGNAAEKPNTETMATRPNTQPAVKAVTLEEEI